MLGFNGHTDVVPPGDPAAWTHHPFAAEIDDGPLYGRGAADMKSGVAAFAAAAVDFVAATPPAGSVILTITGDEEGDGADGTRAMLDWMAADGRAHGPLPGRRAHLPRRAWARRSRSAAAAR